jgi:hypothetical protein
MSVINAVLALTMALVAERSEDCRTETMECKHEKASSYACLVFDIGNGGK